MGLKYKQHHHSHLILIPMLLNCNWFMEIYDITFYKLSSAVINTVQVWTFAFVHYLKYKYFIFSERHKKKERKKHMQHIKD